MSQAPSTEDREHAALQVDAFVEIVSRRYGITPADIVETVRWVRERRAATERMRNFATASLLGTVLAGLLLALWEGVKDLLRRPG